LLLLFIQIIENKWRFATFKLCEEMEKMPKQERAKMKEDERDG
jgi:hypothetical protein